MASRDPEIKDGFSLPVWMRSKPNRDFEPFAASPGAGPEDSFFHIGYPKTETVFGKPQSEQVNKVEAGNDWSRHTKPCQEAINAMKSTTVSLIKPTGIEDAPKTEGVDCGNSVVKVAHQMVSMPSRSVSQRGFTVAPPIDEEDSSGPIYNPGRRGSKSLPVTPAHTPPGSPGSRRKYGNRYFTSPYEPTDDATRGRSWLTNALLGLKRDLATSTSTLAEEDALEIRLHGGTLAESVENLGPAPSGRMSSEPPSQQPKLTKPLHTFRPRPSELREMNFLCPTSM